MNKILSKRESNNSLSLKTNFLGFPVWLWMIFLFLALIKLWLVSEQSLTAYGDAGHDDKLFINLANNILSFQWLGEYSQMTLMKGPFYPMWIAFSHFLGIPLLVSQHFLYIDACLLLIISLRSFLSSKPFFTIFSYAIILFNPASYADGISNRVIREGIYSSLTLLVIAFAFGLFLRFLSKEKNTYLWSIGLGISLSCFWLTREEGIWIVPLLIIIFIYLLIIIFIKYRKKEKGIVSDLIIIFLPFFILGSSLSIVSLVNYMHYGILNTVEFKNKDFLRAYGSLTRIENSNWKQYVPVLKKTRMMAYEVSPKFAELEPYLEGDLGSGWASNAQKNPQTRNIDPSEIAGGWFMWAFRDAVALAGHYKNGKETMNFYKQMAGEIDSACDNGKLDCLSNNQSMTPHWRNEYFSQLVPCYVDTAKRTFFFSNMRSVSSPSAGEKSSLRLFQNITNEPIELVVDQQSLDLLKEKASKNINNDKSPNFKIKILGFIKNLYTYTFSPFLIISIVILFYKIFTRRMKDNDLTLIILSFALILIVILRILIITLIVVTSFPAVDILYTSPLYPPLLIFLLLPLLFDLQRKSTKKDESLSY